MVFENIIESIGNKNNIGIKNLRQGRIYTNNKKKTNQKVIEGMDSANIISGTSDREFKSKDKPTKPWSSDGPYAPADGGSIYRKAGPRQETPETDANGNEVAGGETQYTYKKIRNYRGKFDKMRAIEFKSLTKALKKFNSSRDAYGSDYRKVGISYNSMQDNVRNCKSTCLSDASTKKYAAQDANKEFDDKKYLAFCEAGCHFKGPTLVNTCKDTWKGLKEKQKGNNGNTYAAGAQCDAFHPVCNKNKNMVMRGQYENTILNFKDLRGVSVKNGCCSCGSGSGGTPSYEYDSIKHKSCESLKQHVCGSAGTECGDNSSDWLNVCKNPTFKNPTDGQGKTNQALQSELKKSYDKVVDSNNIMKNKAEFLFSKLNVYDKQLQKLNSEKNNEDDTFQLIMEKYNKTKQELDTHKGVTAMVQKNKEGNPNVNSSLIKEAEAEDRSRMSKDWTRDIMVKESELKRKAEEMQFWMWSVLAIVVGWATIINFRKKTA
jgi:hypothetical protein